MAGLNPVEFYQKFGSAVKEGNHDKAGKLILATSGTTLSFSTVKSLVQKHNSEKLQKIIKKTEKMAQLLGDAVAPADLLKINIYIKQKLKSHIAKKEYIIRRADSGLAHRIEHDPETGRTFIHTDKVLGKGWFKTVTLSVEDKEEPIPVTNGVQLDEIAGCSKREKGFFQKLEGVENVIQARAITRYTDPKDGKAKTAFITPLCNKGSLTQEKAQKLSSKQKMKLTKHYIKALEGIHKKNLVHQDLHAGNLFYSMHDDKVSGTLADYGHMKEVAEAQGKMPSKGDKTHDAPELSSGNLHTIDRKSAEIYSMGSLLRSLFIQPGKPLDKKGKALDKILQSMIHEKSTKRPSALNLLKRL